MSSLSEAVGVEGVSAVLAATIDGQAASFAVQPGGGTFPASAFQVKIDNEILLVGAQSGGVFSGVTRAQEGTAAWSHPAGAAVVLVVGGEAIAAGGGGGSSPFAVATVTLTDAQIKALPTTPVQIVAAPGAGQILVPIFCWMHLTWVADYTNVGDTGKLGLEWGATASSTLAPLTQVTGQVGNLLQDGASHGAWLPQRAAIDGTTSDFSGVGQASDDPEPVNAALNLYATNSGSHTGVYTGGDPGNSLQVTVYYATSTN